MFFHLVRSTGFFLWLAAACVAQINISGSISDSSGGPLLTGQTYHVTGNLNVPAGQTLNIQPGAILKFANTTILTVSGTLNGGAPAGPVVLFTSSQDDAAGADTTPGNMTTGAQGLWRGINLQSGGTANFSKAEIRFAGSLGQAAISLSSPNLSIDDLLIRECSAEALLLNGHVPVQVANLAIENCGSAVNSAPILALPRFTGCTSSGVVSGNVIEVTSTSINSNLTITRANTLNADGVVEITTNQSLLAGVTLTVGAGVILKCHQNVLWSFSGTLITQGTALEPVVFTSVTDDSVGGDTRNDGPTSGTPGFLRTLSFQNSSDASVLAHTECRFAGAIGAAAITLNQANISLFNVIVRDTLLEGISLSGNSFPQISGLHVDGATRPFDLVPIHAIPGFSGLSATNVTGGETLHVTPATVSSALVLAKSQTVNQNGVLALNATPAVQAGHRLEIQAGMILKLETNSLFAVSGELDVLGTPLEPVVLTSRADDRQGGDSDGDGATSGAAGDWRGINFASGSDASEIRHAKVHFTGALGTPAILANLADIEVTDTEFSDSLSEAINLSSNSRPILERVTMRNCEASIDQVPLSAIPGFRDLSATNCLLGNVLRVSSGAGGFPTEIHKFNLIEDVLFFATNINVGATDHVTLNKGIIVKLPLNSLLTVNGALNLLGTGFEPIIITSREDDLSGGDSDNSGPSVGAPGQIRALNFPAGAAASRVENVVLRFGGALNTAGFLLSSPLLSGRSLRAEFCAADGFNISALAGDGFNFVAHHCLGDGFELTSGSFDLVHATAADNLGAGFRRTSWSGQVRSSLAEDNAAGNYIGFLASHLFFSSGSAALAGTNGNIDMDPLFVDAANSDYRLSASSPALGAAELAPAFLISRDHQDRSRILDHALTGSALPDMGAFERDVFRLTVFGDSRRGELLTATLDGDLPGIGLLFAGLEDGREFFAPLGFLNAGTSPAILILNTLFTGQPMVIEVPDVPFLVGLDFALQGVVFDLTNPGVGQFTEVWRSTVF